MVQAGERENGLRILASGPHSVWSLVLSLSLSSLSTPRGVASLPGYYLYVFWALAGVGCSIVVTASPQSMEGGWGETHINTRSGSGGWDSSVQCSLRLPMENSIVQRHYLQHLPREGSGEALMSN